MGRSRGGLTTKIHAIVDALGNPLGVSLTGDQVHDITQAEALAAQVAPEALIADRGYDAGGFIESLEVRAIRPVIPPKANRKTKRDCDFARLMPNATLSGASSIPSNTSGASPPATKKLPATSSRAAISSAHSLGSNDHRP